MNELCPYQNKSQKLQKTDSEVELNELCPLVASFCSLASLILLILLLLLQCHSETKKETGAGKRQKEKSDVEGSSGRKRKILLNEQARLNNQKKKGN